MDRNAANLSLTTSESLRTVIVARPNSRPDDFIAELTVTARRSERQLRNEPTRAEISGTESVAVRDWPPETAVKGATAIYQRVQKSNTLSLKLDLDMTV